jgi:hypothetical protein
MSREPVLIVEQVESTGRSKPDPARRGLVRLRLTGGAMKSHREHALTGRCIGCMSKQIDTHALPRVVSAHPARRLDGGAGR